MGVKDKKLKSIKTLLDGYVVKYNRKDFICQDPISIPHQFSKKQDIEIMAFWISMLSWGNRTSIINSGMELIKKMNGKPLDFILYHSHKEAKKFASFKHRTFNGIDALYFLRFFQNYYRENNSLENAFTRYFSYGEKSIKNALMGFKNFFFSLQEAPKRTQKHISSPQTHSACKRMNMFLRWMVRKDANGVDFGIWENIGAENLLCPLDVHVLRAAVSIGLLHKKASANWKTTTALTQQLRCMNEKDPVIYDYALFGIGMELKNTNKWKNISCL